MHLEAFDLVILNRLQVGGCKISGSLRVVRSKLSKIDVVCAGFAVPFDEFNRNEPIEVTNLEILLAIATVGIQSFWKLSDWEVKLSRLLTAASTCLYLKEESQGLCMSDAFEKIDTSEKSIVSYWLGMGFAKIVAAKILGVVHLQGVDNLKNQGTLNLANNIMRRGDLIGLDRKQQWHAIEAKGRSTDRKFTVKQNLAVDAKNQSKNIASVHNKKIATNSACLAALRTNPISLLLFDPPAGEIESLPLNPSEFYKRYYADVIKTINFLGSVEKEINGQRFVVATLSIGSLPARPSLNWELKLGLLKDFYDSPEKAGEIECEPLCQENSVVGRDGIYIYRFFYPGETVE